MSPNKNSGVKQSEELSDLFCTYCPEIKPIKENNRESTANPPAAYEPAPVPPTQRLKERNKNHVEDGDGPNQTRRVMEAT